MRAVPFIPDPRLLVPAPAPPARGIVLPRPARAPAPRPPCRRCRRCRRPIRADRQPHPRRPTRRPSPYWSPLQRLYALAGDTWLDEAGNEILAADPSGDVRLANADQEAGDACCDCELPPVECNCCDGIPQPAVRAVAFTPGLCCFSFPAYFTVGVDGSASERKVYINDMSPFAGVYDVENAEQEHTCNWLGYFPLSLPEWVWGGPFGTTQTPTGNSLDIYLRVYIALRKGSAAFSCQGVGNNLAYCIIEPVSSPGIANFPFLRPVFDWQFNPSPFECLDGATIDASAQTSTGCSFGNRLGYKGNVVIS